MIAKVTKELSRGVVLEDQVATWWWRISAAKPGCRPRSRGSPVAWAAAAERGLTAEATGGGAPREGLRYQTQF